MKKLMYYLFLFLGFSHFAKAQIQQGTKTASGSIGFYSTTYTSKLAYNGITTQEASTSGTQLKLAPKAGLMLTDNIMVGTGLLITSGDDSSLTSGSSSSFAISPFGRYYFPAGDKFYAFGEFSLLLGSGSSWNIGGGASYFLKDNVAIEGLLTFNQAVRFGIGLQFYFD